MQSKVIYSIFLGVLQGITEFLPISSSGHLVLVQNFLTGFQSPGLVFDVLLHAGTLLAVISYYRRDLIWMIRGLLGQKSTDENLEARLLVKMIIIGSIPAAVFGLLAEEPIEKLFENPVYTSIFLMLTGGILCLGEWLHRRQAVQETHEKNGSLLHSLIIGFAQACALFPGISRSGSTMAAGLALGWNRKKTARFSFLLMIPVVAGAVLLKLPEIPQLISTGAVSTIELFSGFISAIVSGYLSIKLLLGMIKKFSFLVFGYYCLFAGAVSFCIFFF